MNHDNHRDTLYPNVCFDCCKLALELVTNALRELREAQKAYMADRGNNALGQVVALRAQVADAVLERME